MAVTGTISVSGTLVGGPIGQRVINTVNTVTAGIDGSITQTLAIASTTIAVPTGATLAIIAVTGTTTGTMILKGVAGDTGVVLDTTGKPTLLSWTTAPANFVLTVAVATVPVQIQFA